MRTVLPLLVPLALVGCADTDEAGLSARAELLLSSTDGAEEIYARTSADADVTPVEEVDQPDAFRECDAEGDFVGIFAGYDEDADGELGPPEEDAVFDARSGRSPEQDRQARQRWDLLLLVYDLDGDHDLSAAEEATLFEDFTARCSAIHDRLLADFDADGDGVLSDAEQEAAREAMDAMRAASGPPEGAEGGMESGPPDGADGERPDGGPECDGDGPPPEGAVPPELAAFDTDGDGTFSDAELSALRDELRAHIRAGDPLCGPPQEAPAL